MTEPNPHQEQRDDTGLFQIVCPHCKTPIPVPLIQAFQKQRLIYTRCDSCGNGITKKQIDETYREYHQ